MRVGRVWRLVSAVIVASSIVACGGDPPDKEIQQAQTAVDAARAASAERYAKEDFVASTDALKNAHAAVDARDYRLALNYALEAKERADTAARDAAERKVTARSNADRALRNAALALVDVRAKLRAAQAAQPPGVPRPTARTTCKKRARLSTGRIIRRCWRFSPRPPHVYARVFASLMESTLRGEAVAVTS